MRLRSLWTFNNWHVNNKLPLNAAKSNVMSFGRMMYPILYNYRIDGDFFSM